MNYRCFGKRKYFRKNQKLMRNEKNQENGSGNNIADRMIWSLWKKSGISVEWKMLH